MTRPVFFFRTDRCARLLWRSFVRRATADAWNFGLCATKSREPRQARKGATVPGSLRAPRSTRSSSHLQRASFFIGCGLCLQPAPGTSVKLWELCIRVFGFQHRGQRAQRRNYEKRPGSDRMSYQVIARKWRPQTFADVVGQQHVTRTLSNAVQSGRVAHAYIFSGARGVGKTTTARILAKALNCAKGPASEPCNECDSCREIGLGNSLDVIEIDAASNRGIDQIRELREMVRYAPAGGRYKVVILDEAHMLTDEASNALLKTLEEPPDKVIFVMATTQPEDLADTIRSRSQHFHFRPLSFAEISAALEQICAKENLTAEAGAIGVMARAAEGSLRDALSLLEQARAYCGSNITDAQVRDLLGVVPGEILDELTGAIEERSAERVLSLVHRLLAEGQNLQHF